MTKNEIVNLTPYLLEASYFMKILFVNTDIGYGGAEKMIVWLANQCVQNGHDVTFITYRDGTEMQPLSHLVKHVHMQLEDSGAGLSMFKTVKYFHNIIKKEKFDVGIAFLSPSILRLAIAAVGTNIKLLFSHRADPYYHAPHKTLKQILFCRLNNLAFKRADYYVFQTSVARAYFGKRIQECSMVIANPIKPLVRTRERNGNVEKKIVAVGRLDLKQKRQDILISAFNILSPKYPDYILEIYGSGEDENRIKKLADSNSRIKMMGNTNNVADVIQNAAVFVLSSDFEGIPNALLEAMSMGVPCVASDCSPGGAAMLINNKKNGLLVPRNSAEKMAKAICYMLDHPNEAELMALEAMTVNEKYSEGKISRLWMRAIAKLA